MRYLVSMIVALGGCIPPQGAQPYAYPAQPYSAPQPYPAPQPEYAPQPEGQPAAPPTGEPVPALAGGAATGERVDDESAGWEVRTPKGWKHGVQNGRVMFGSDQEAGAIFVTFLEGTTYEQAVAGLDAQIRTLGATAVGAPRSETVPGGRALVAELSGVIDGAPAMGRVIGIAGPSGLLVLLAITSSDKLPALRPRVDAIAKSARFFAPSRGEVALVSGCFRYTGGSTAVSVERTLYFDGAGHFSRSGFVGAQSQDYAGRATGTSATLASSGDGGTYQLQGRTAILLRWNSGGTSTFQLEYDRGAVGALITGKQYYLRCQ